MSSSWRRARRHPSFAIGLALTAAIVATAVCSLVYTPRDPLRMEITAEGIETQAHCEEVRRVGCTRAQGSSTRAGTA